MNFSNGSTEASCHLIVSSKISYHIWVIPAVLIICVLWALQRRVGEKCSCCLQRGGGIVIPMNWLDGYDDPWSHAFACGAMSNRLFSLFLHAFNNPDVFFNVPTWAFFPLSVLACVETGVIFYPLLACLHSHYTLPASILGLLYSFSWLAAGIVEVAYCPGMPGVPVLDYMNVVMVAPVLFATFALSLRYIISIVYCLQTKKYGYTGEIQEIASAEDIMHTRELTNGSYILRTQTQDTSKLNCGRNIRKLFKVSITDSGFRYPVRLYVVFTVTIGLLYLFEVLVFEFAVFLRKIAKMYASQADLHVDEGPFTLLFVSVTLGSLLACVIALFNGWLMPNVYRKDLTAMWRGERNFLGENKFVQKGPSMTVGNALRYSGFQVAYSIWGYIFQSITFIIVILLLGGLGYLIDYTHWAVVKWIFLVLVLPLVWSFAFFYYGQALAARLFFLQPKIVGHDKRSLNVDNRRGYNVFSFFALILNIPLGIFSSLKRLLTGALLGLLLLPRLDTTLMPRGYENWDRAYMSYVATLYLDLNHTHPVLRCFCGILLSLHYNENSTTSKRALQRWKLAYTLMKNPDLQKLRKRKRLDSSFATSTELQHVAIGITQAINDDSLFH